jgi:hypothetical protein
MKELASVAVRTVGGSVELVTELGFIVIGQMGFLVQLMLSMGEGTVVLKLALLEELPIPTHLGFVLHLVLFDKVISLLFRVEVLLGSLHSGNFEDVRTPGLFIFFWRNFGCLLRRILRVIVMLVFPQLCRHI